MAIALAVALVTAAGLAAAGPAGAVVPPGAPTTITPRSAVFTAGTADSQAVRANGSAAGKHVTCVAFGTADCFGHQAGEADGLSYGQVGNHWVVYSDGTTPVGTYRTSVQGCNKAGCMQPMVFTLKVVAAPVITLQPASPLFHAGSPTVETTTITSTTPTPISPTRITCANCAAVLPAGLTFTNTPFADPGTAHIAGRAAAGTGGTYTVRLTATAQDKGVTTEAVSIIVEQGNALTSTGVTLLAGQSVNVPTIGTTGLPPVRVITESGSLPEGVTFHDLGNGSFLLTGLALNGSGGSYPLAITLDNHVTAPVTVPFTITVDQAPAIRAGYPYPVFATAGSHVSYSYAPYVSGYPQPTVTWSGALPSGVSFGGGCGYATLCGTPAAHTGANWFGTLHASNSVSSATNGALLQVLEAPYFSGSTSATFYATEANTSDPVTTYGGYNPPARLSTVGTLPGWLSFDAATGTFSGTPQPSDSGTYDIAVQACNGYYPSVPTLAQCRTETYQLLVQGPAPTLPRSAPTSDGLLAGVSLLTFAGSSVTWTGSGYAPHAVVTVGMYPTSTYTHPVPVGTYTADASGTVTITGPVPGVSGIYDVVAAGYAQNGRVRYLTGQTNIR